MKNFYFTFGSNHLTTGGYRMNNNWVRVIAIDYETARTLFIERWSTPFMERPMGWSTQYKEEDFEPNYFPRGELVLITQTN